jgi:hypothetical protein
MPFRTENAIVQVGIFDVEQRFELFARIDFADCQFV